MENITDQAENYHTSESESVKAELQSSMEENLLTESVDKQIMDKNADIPFDSNSGVGFAEEDQNLLENADPNSVNFADDDGDESGRDAGFPAQEKLLFKDDLNGHDRNTLFEKAEFLLSKSKIDLALECYLKCIKGLEKGSGFLYLPQCLHQIAEVYHRKQDDHKAVQFLKAEKIYYETALIDTKQMQHRISIKEEITQKSEDVDPLDSAVLRAAEYESLAKLCLDRHQCELALEFSGKATKLYQQNYGDDHPSTQRSLDFLTSVYAEVGKEEYAAKLSAYESTKGDVEVPSVRRRKRSGNTSQTSDDMKPPPVKSSSSFNPAPGQLHSDEITGFTFAFLVFIMILCALVAVFFFGFVFCHLTPTSWTCHSIRVQYKNVMEYISFMIYKWTRSS